MPAGMTMEEFLGHSTRGSRGQMLKGWSKSDGKILVWLSRKAKIHALWRHGFQKVVELKDKPPEIWGEKFPCFEEDEEILKNQNARDRDTKARKFPPQKCGYCRFLEDLYQEIVGGRMSWTEPVFQFQTPDKQKTMIMRAGGMLGFFGSPKLTDDEKLELREAGVFVKEAFKQVSKVKAEYLFCVVKDDDPKAGVQITIEPAGLGDKMRLEIKKQIKSRREKGDPYQNPYPFLWEYDDKAESFNDYYSVTPMIDERLSPEIAKLIDGPPPNVEGILKGQSKKMIRAALEEHCLIGIDWDDYFPPGEAEADSKDKDEAPGEISSQDDDGLDGSLASVGVGKAGAIEASSKKEAPADEDLVACDDCEKAMKATDPKCPHCGKAYEVEQAAPAEPPPPPALKKRSEAKKELAEKAAPAPAEKKPVQSKLPSAAFEGGNDDIPF